MHTSINLSMIRQISWLLLAAFMTGAFYTKATGSAPAADTVRAQVGAPLQAAHELIRQKKFKEALVKVNEAARVGSLTEHEAFVIEQTRASAATGAGETVIALRAYEKVLVAKRLPAADQLRLMEAVAIEYYRGKNYQKALEWLSQYRSNGGQNAQTLLLISQVYYLSQDYAKAATEVGKIIEADERAGRVPQEDQLKLLASCAIKQNDQAAYLIALEKLVTHYPRQDYWLDLIQRVALSPGFSDRLQLDVVRLRLATDTLRTSTDYLEMSQLALQAGLPGEAKKVFDQGLARSILGTGADVERQNRLRSLIESQVAEDRKTIAQTVKDAAAAAHGDALVNTGLAYVMYGDIAKGLPLIEQGLKKGQLKRPGEATLHLGYAYWLAGQKAKAIRTFKTVKNPDGSGALARLWVILLSKAA